MRWLAIVLVLTCGCSVMHVERAPKRPWVSRPECTTSRSTVKKDLLTGGAVAAVGLVLLVIGSSMEDPDPDNPLERGGELNNVVLAGAITVMGASVVFGGSAGYGLNATTKCRKAHAAYDRGVR